MAGFTRERGDEKPTLISIARRDEHGHRERERALKGLIVTLQLTVRWNYGLIRVG